jgi:multiple sugar transport system substrate-binding protein
MTGNAAYDSVFGRMENLADEALGLDLACIRPGLLSHDADGRVLMVPIFSTSYGMLINNDLFEKEGLAVPKTLQELLELDPRPHYKDDPDRIYGFTFNDRDCHFRVRERVAEVLSLGDISKK